MKFSEKLRALRLEKKLSQQALADLVGTSVRTIQNYETADKLPKRRETYDSLARALDVDAADLMDENADFLVNAGERYGSRGERQARAILEQVQGLYAGGELSPEDMEAFNRALQEAYWEAKEINRKFIPKKYRSPRE